MIPVPLVTIITPVFNSEKHLDDCIDSILKQNYTNFELLLVNDGSTDGSAKICKEYAIKDTRVKIFHQENKGVSAARNFALESAKGEWIAFVDSDDSVLPNYIEDLITAGDQNTDLVVHGFRKIYKSVSKNFDLGNHILSTKANEDKVFEQMKIFDFGFVVSKLYKKSIIYDNQIFFSLKTSHAEDLIFFLEYISFSDRIVFQNKHNYLYYQRENSLSVTFQKPDVYFYQYKLIKEILKNKFMSVYSDLYTVPKGRFTYTSQIQFSTLLKFLKSMYYHKLSKEERFYYFQMFQGDDLSLLKINNKKSIRNPILKMAYHSLGTSHYLLGDVFLLLYYKMVNMLVFLKRN